MSDFELRFGEIVKVADPELWLRVTKKFWLRGDDNGGRWARVNLIIDTMRDRAPFIPQFIAAQQLSEDRRIVAKLDFFNDSLTAFFGQRVPLINFKNRHGFDRCKVRLQCCVPCDLTVSCLQCHNAARLQDDNLVDLHGHAINMSKMQASPNLLMLIIPRAVPVLVLRMSCKVGAGDARAATGGKRFRARADVPAVHQ